MSRGIYDSVNKVRIPTCGREDFNVDNELSSGSQNAVENRVITAAINKKYSVDDTAETNLADGDYIPFYDTSATAKRKTSWSNVVSKIKAALSAVAVSGSYTDLSNKPTIPGLQNVLTSDSTTDALTANMGKTLATQISNMSAKIPAVYAKCYSTSEKTGATYGEVTLYPLQGMQGATLVGVNIISLNNYLVTYNNITSTAAQVIIRDVLSGNAKPNTNVTLYVTAFYTIS